MIKAQKTEVHPLLNPPHKPRRLIPTNLIKASVLDEQIWVMVEFKKAVEEEIAGVLLAEGELVLGEVEGGGFSYQNPLKSPIPIATIKKATALRP